MSAEPTPPTRRWLPAWIRHPAALYLGIGLGSLLSSWAVSLVLPRYVPNGADEFANLLAGQTYARGALTNPPHPLWEFFETQHVLMQPTYMAKYPPAQGLFLAAGIWLGNPLLGVWLASALFAVAIAWMVRGFFPLRWALLAAILAIGQFGLGCYWTQGYWGGMPAALGGALLFGGTRRLWRGGGGRDGILLGLGVVLLMLSRPFEGMLVCLLPAILLLLGLCTRRVRWSAAACCGVVIFAGGCFLLASNARVTGSSWEMPYMAYEKQYSAAPLFIWQRMGPDPHFRHADMARLYESYIKFNSQHYGPLHLIWWWHAKRTFLFQLGGLLGATALAGVLLRPARWVLLAWLMVGLVSTALVVAYWVQFHYEAPMAALLIFAAVHGVRALVLKFPWRRRALWLTAAFTAAYGLWLVVTPVKRPGAVNFAQVRQDIIDHATAQHRRLLVIVRQENPVNQHFDWIYNDALIDRSPVVWARDCGEVENRRLIRYFHDRNILLLINHPVGAEFVPYPGAPAPSPAAP